jgi:large subunit ribosomal protein L6
MSRIGKRPVTVPAGVTVTVAGSTVTVKGPRGELTRTLNPELGYKVEGAEFTVSRPSEAERHKALHGLSRTLVANMVEGVTKGFSPFKAPAGIKISVENNTVVKIEGADKEKVGQVAAEIRLVRPPEPYKGKGIRYQGEQVRRKAGKTGAK